MAHPKKSWTAYAYCDFGLHVQKAFSHAHAIRHGTGVPSKEVTDNLKALIEKMRVIDIERGIGYIEQIRNRSFGSLVDGEALHNGLWPIWEEIHKDLSARHVIALDRDSVSRHVRDLAQLNLTDSQNSLLEETIRCFEVGIYRSAIVNGWNLAYDFVRQWIFNQHRADFNNALVANYTRRNGTPQFDAIVDYGDFLRPTAPSEFVVLEVCNAANKIPGRICDSLIHHLRERNEHAHPTESEPTPAHTNAYIEGLARIITRDPFK